MTDDATRRADPDETARERLRDQIDLGLEQARRGELLDGEEVFRILEERGDAQPEQSAALPEPEFEPKTDFERLLWEARSEFLLSGDPMLDWDGLEREIAERRGGVSEAE